MVIKNHELRMEDLTSKSLHYQKWNLIISAIGIFVVLVSSATNFTLGIAVSMIFVLALVLLYKLNDPARGWVSCIDGISDLRTRYLQDRKTSRELAEVTGLMYRSSLESNYGIAIASKRQDIADYFARLINEYEGIEANKSST